MRTLNSEGRWIMRSHIDWKGEQNTLADVFLKPQGEKTQRIQYLLACYVQTSEFVYKFSNVTRTFKI